MDEEEEVTEPLSEDELDPLSEGAINDFRFDEDTDDDPDRDH